MGRYRKSAPYCAEHRGGAVQVHRELFFVPLVFGLNWKRGTAAGAVSAMLGGLLACGLWDFVDWGQGSWKDAGVDAVEVGLVVSGLLYLFVSRLTPAPPKESLQQFFESEKLEK